MIGPVRDPGKGESMPCFNGFAYRSSAVPSRSVLDSVFDRTMAARGLGGAELDSRRESFFFAVSYPATLCLRGTGLKDICREEGSDVCVGVRACWICVCACAMAIYLHVFRLVNRNLVYIAVHRSARWRTDAQRCWIH